MLRHLIALLVLCSFFHAKFRVIVCKFIDCLAAVTLNIRGILLETEVKRLIKLHTI